MVNTPFDSTDDERHTEIPEAAGGNMSDDLDNMPTVVPGDGESADIEREQQSIALEPGTMLSDRFEILSTLGMGGMGTVFKVADKSMPGVVKALKVMLPSLVNSGPLRKRFVDEVQVAQRLTHRNIVRVHDLGHHDDLQYFTMELVDGHTLHDHLRQRGGKLSLDEVLPIVLQMCDGLEEAHRSTVHRDLKPQNIMMQSDGTVKLLDFGLAKLIDPGQRAGTMGPMGTAYYEAPEQRVHGAEIGPRADIYALGVVLYQMLTGQLPTGMAKPPSKWQPSVPPALDLLVGRMLETDPNERPSSVTEVRDALKNMAGGKITVPSPAPKRKSSKLPIVMVGGTLLAVAIVLMFFPVRKQDVAELDISGDAIQDTRQEAQEPSPPPVKPIVIQPDPEIARQEAAEREAKSLVDARAETYRAEAGLKNLERRNAEQRTQDLKDAESAKKAMDTARQAAERNNAAKHAPDWFSKGQDDEQQGDKLIASDEYIDAATSYKAAASHYERAAEDSSTIIAAINAERNEVAGVRDDALKERELAVGLAASEFAPREWVSAEETFASAGDIFAKKSFDSAKQQFAAAANAYKKAASVATRYVPAMILVKSGTFKMGSPEGEIGRDSDEGPVHSRALSDFYLAAHEVTVAQFKVFVDKTGYKTTAEQGGGTLIYEGDSRPQQRGDANWKNPYFDQTDNHPVTCVSWQDATAYCKWLGKLTGKQYRLPTEAEWEYACRAGNTAPSIFTGNTSNFNGVYPYGSNETGQFRRSTVPATEFSPNKWGFYNMHGNVTEWCADWYSETAYTSAKTPASGRTRVIRGGAWNSMGKELRPANRSAALPDTPNNTTGFRPARTK